MSNTARRSNAVYFLFWLIIKRDGGRLRRTKFEVVWKPVLCFQTASNLCKILKLPNRRHSRAGGNLVGVKSMFCPFKAFCIGKDSRLRGNDGCVLLRHRFAYQVRHLLLYVKRLAVGGFQYKDQAAVANSLSRMPTGTA